MKLIGLAGSLRTGSYNAALLRAAAELAPDDLELEVATIAGIPLYDGDLEASDGVPPAVAALKDRIAEADGLLLVTPEYNHSLPGTFKNAIDWLSRPPADIERVFGGLPVGLMGATPGRGATHHAHLAWLPVLHTLGTRPYTGTYLGVARARQVFDDRLQLADDTVKKLLTKYLAGFADFVRACGRGRTG